MATMRQRIEWMVSDLFGIDPDDPNMGHFTRELRRTMRLYMMHTDVMDCASEATGRHVDLTDPEDVARHLSDWVSALIDQALDTSFDDGFSMEVDIIEMQGDSGPYAFAATCTNPMNTKSYVGYGKTQKEAMRRMKVELLKDFSPDEIRMIEVDLD